MISQDDYDRLVEIRDQMLDLLEEARHLVRRADKHTYERAQAYAFGWIENGLDSGNPHDVDLTEILGELTIEGDEDEEWDDEEEEGNGPS